MRQLVYDFRLWKKLEAIGRSGDDEGIDIRGVEPLGGEKPALSDQFRADDEERELVTAEPGPTSEERVWIIQCKRERSIGPKKARQIINGFFSAFPPSR